MSGLLLDVLVHLGLRTHSLTHLIARSPRLEMEELRKALADLEGVEGEECEWGSVGVWSDRVAQWAGREQAGDGDGGVLKVRE